MTRPHAGLVVYQKALDANDLTEVIARSIDGDRRDLVDQLRRASASIALNIAEGASEFSGPEKARFYRIARRSTSECHAIIDLAERLVRNIPDPEPARDALDAVVAMLTAMIKNKSK